MNVTYKKLKLKGNPVQVDSAIRDDKGRIISKHLDKKANLDDDGKLIIEQLPLNILIDSGDLDDEEEGE